MQIETIGAEGLAALRRKRVAVIGVGNVGGQVAAHNAVLDIGQVLVDPDVVSVENLGTQGFCDDDVGLSKVEARASSLARLNPACRIATHRTDVARLGLGALRDVDLIYACPDNHAARAAISEIAVRLGIPWVDAAIDGSGRSFLCRVAAYPTGADAACFLCPYDRQSLIDLLQPHSAGGCPRWSWENAGDATPPTLATSAVGGAAAAAQVQWGLQILLARGAGVLGCEVYFDFVHARFTTHRLPRNPSCVFDHQRFPLSALGPVGAVTVAETFAAAEIGLAKPVTLGVHRTSLVTVMRCPGCERQRNPGRVLAAITADDARCSCGEVMQPLAPGLRSRLDRKSAAAMLDRTWEQIGLPPDDVVSAYSTTGTLHFLLAGGQA